MCPYYAMMVGTSILAVALRHTYIQRSKASYDLTFIHLGYLETKHKSKNWANSGFSTEFLGVMAAAGQKKNDKLNTDVHLAQAAGNVYLIA